MSFTNNKFMKVFLITLLIILIIFSISFDIKINLQFDLFKNLGSIKIKIFKFITIFSIKFTVIGDYINVNLSKKEDKVVKIKIDINDENLQFINDFGGNLMQKVYSTKLVSNINFCLENPHIVSILSALTNLLFTYIFIKLKSKNKDLTIQNNVDTGFRHNLINVDFTYEFIISIYDMVWSLIKALLKRRRLNYAKGKV